MLSQSRSSSGLLGQRPGDLSRKNLKTAQNCHKRAGKVSGVLREVLKDGFQRDSTNLLHGSPQQKRPILGYGRSRFPNVKMEQAKKKELESGEDDGEHCEGLDSSSQEIRDLLDDTLNISEDDSLDIVVVPREAGRTEDHNQQNMITILDDSADEQVRELEKIFSQATIVKEELETPKKKVG